MEKSGRKIVTIVFLFIIFLISCNTESKNDKSEAKSSVITPHIVKMMRGINIGNTLEPPDEGGWNNGELQKYYFEDYKNAGFSSIRIPVKWGTHTSENPPFTINPDWIERVEEIVDWGLDQDLYIIINGHHDDWLKEDFSPINQARYDSIWSQISQRFQSKSPKLLFEIFNEPIGLTTDQVNKVNASVLSIIRKTNPTRIVLYSGRDYSGLQYMKEVAIPDDHYIMAYFHSYDPWSFAGEGKGTWGTTADQNSIAAMFQEAALWSDTHNIPVMINEFGAVHSCDYNSRMLHYFTYVENAIKYNIGFQVWDDGGNFGIYDREKRQWPEVKDILINTYPESPTDLNIIVDGNPKVAVISWKNRTSQNESIIIQRKVGDGEFELLTELNADATRTVDENISQGNTYTYRIISQFKDEQNFYSYPKQIIVD